MKKTIFIVLVSLLCVIQTNAQNTLQGVVTDAQTGEGLPSASVQIQGTTIGAITDLNGFYKIEGIAADTVTVQVDFIGCETKTIAKLVLKKQETNVLNVKMTEYKRVLQSVAITSGSVTKSKKRTRKKTTNEPISLGYFNKQQLAPSTSKLAPKPKKEVENDIFQGIEAGNVSLPLRREPEGTDEYNTLEENVFTKTVGGQALTTFSIDVDRASYTTTRAALENGVLPTRKSLRLEEFINYFDYKYAEPKGSDPIAVETELADSPWNKNLKLLRIGLQAKRIDTKNLPASNLVFLIDVSGSMGDDLELVKDALLLLVEQLREQDKVSIVVYAGSSGLVLPGTSGSKKQIIKAAIDSMKAGGSTAGGAGIKLAYNEAMKNFVKTSNNRIILCTDGDFNVGVSSDAELQSLIEENRKTGVFLSCLGFGSGNYKDNHMETLADKGNGNYTYIDNIGEAKKVFIKEFGGTIFTVAKDVKLQIEFNPTQVKAYRLIGYENRRLNNEDFNDDKKDAGEMGSGHTVTAIYEIIPQDIDSDYLKTLDSLKYQKTGLKTAANNTNEMATLKIRYKQSDSDISQKKEHIISTVAQPFEQSSENFRFAMAVVEFGLLLRQSEYKGTATYAQAKQLAVRALGADTEGYRKELLEMIDIATRLDK
jgi:Ca-activated chloride channel homolog